MESLKNFLKSKMPKDENHRLQEEVQELTDAQIKKVDDLLAAKTKEINTL
jgi:ribosome recycling factor